MSVILLRPEDVAEKFGVSKLEVTCLARCGVVEWVDVAGLVRFHPETIKELDIHSFGYTYFVQPIKGGPIKIGKTTRIDPKARLAQLQIGSPLKLDLLGTCLFGMEGYLHKKFKHLRVHGEWFKATVRLRRWIRENARLTEFGETMLGVEAVK